MTDAWIREHLASLIEADEIVLHDAGVVRITVSVGAFAELFAAVDTVGTAGEVCDRLLAADVVWLDANGNVVAEGTADATQAARGYTDYIRGWHDAGLLG